MTSPLTKLSSFGDAMNAVVVGASGGIGSSVTSHLAAMTNVRRIVALSRTPIRGTHKIFSHHIDLEDVESIEFIRNLVHPTKMGTIACRKELNQLGSCVKQ